MLLRIQIEGRQRGKIQRPVAAQSFHRHGFGPPPRTARTGRRQTSVPVEQQAFRGKPVAVENLDVNESVGLCSQGAFAQLARNEQSENKSSRRLLPFLLAIPVHPVAIYRQIEDV